MTDPAPSPIAKALGRIPCGLYIVSSLQDGGRLGFVGSLLIQTGFEPPTVCVAIGKGRAALDAVRRTGHFAVSILDAGSQKLMTPFFKPVEPGSSPFDKLATLTAPSGCPVLEEALAWLDCKLTGEHAVGDHIVVFGEVTAGAQQHDGDPSVHLRRNGLGY
jgi:flavin reductase (DIM6/NTAB) family NADH-FMN oxidoreductase RutF